MLTILGQSIVPIVPNTMSWKINQIQIPNTFNDVIFAALLVEVEGK